MPNERPIIALLTDFGTRDPYVGIMKGVMAGICPEAVVIDITHDVIPQAVLQGAFLLGCALPWFPDGTIFVAVVDPGVGSERRAIAAAGLRATYVGPDNGVLERALELDPPRMIVDLRNPQYRLPVVSPTFHGRDIFAPAAAHIAAGVPVEALGPRVADPIRRPWSTAQRLPEGTCRGSVCHIDRFGNCITDIPGEWIDGERGGRLSLPGCGVSARFVRTYADAPAGTAAAVVGGSGFLELAVVEGSAAEIFGVRIGDAVRFKNRTCNSDDNDGPISREARRG